MKVELSSFSRYHFSITKVLPMFHRLILSLVLLLTAASAQSKSLYWPAITVDAQLDGNGLLHVSETQTYIFNGDWNGGERQFNIRAGQALNLEGVDRIDGTKIIPLTRGNLAAVDHYDLLKDSKLRWRSRLPADPEFENTELTYRIRYTLSGVLRGRNNHFKLGHDFIFPDRQGDIKHFTLHFTLDPAWSGIQSPMTVNEDNLGPGRSVIVRGDLQYHGAASPNNAIVLLSPWVGYGILVLLAAGLMTILLRFLDLERKVGRIGNLTPLEEIDEQWLKKTVFSLPPEVIGAAWDGKVGAAEIAAILATLEHEKKIKSGIQPHFLRKPIMTMQLLVDRKSITGYHGSVINKLFFNSRVNTDTNAIKEQYKNKGLDLAAIIEKPIEQRLSYLAKWNEKTNPVNWKVDMIAMPVAFALLVLTGVLGGDNDGALASTVALLGVCSLGLAIIAARFHYQAIDNLPLRFAFVVAFALPLIIPTIHYLLNAPDYLFRFPVLMAAAIWSLAIFNLILDALRIDEAPEKIAIRKKLLSARIYFMKQLRSSTPHLSDDWFPYILAFGLGSNVDSWFRSYGKTTAGVDTANHVSSSGSFSGSSTSGSSWSGGGGSFGGAGASGSWAAAAAAVGAGVSAPGSSSGGSSSGGGGGGSSSGGGGGGGW
jgi:uncharacterized membrane protein YgcG